MLVNLTKLDSPGKRNSSVASKRLACELVCWAFSQLIIDMGGPSSCGQSHCQTGGHGLYKKADQPTESKPASSALLFLL